MNKIDKEAQNGKKYDSNSSRNTIKIQPKYGQKWLKTVENGRKIDKMAGMIM